MNLMDMAKGLMENALGNNNAGGMIQVVAQLIEKNGGIQGLVQKFSQNGMGDVVQSWVSTGQNMPINASQIAQVFGNDQIAQIAKSLNLDSSAITGQLAQMLPNVIDKLTPDGQAPTGGVDMNQIMSLAKSFLSK
jgi:uncharacterized protein YidB (DUF937 family)